MVVVMSSNGMPSHPTSYNDPPDYEENGRLYHGYLKGTYMYPCDEDEKDRLDIFHKFFSVARRDVLHSAPLTPNYDGPRILDLGTGTGIWAIDMADKYPAAEVIGWDISLIQPGTIPPNLSFRRRNIDAPWHGVPQDAFDLINIRSLDGAVESWMEIYAKIFRHLKPDYGHLEHVEIDFQPRCDDNSISPAASVFQWAQYLNDATARAYKPLAYNTETMPMLQRLGYVDITEQVIKVPMNPWPADPHQKDIGRWYNLGFCQGLEAMTLAPLTRMVGWPKSSVDRLIADVKREVCTKRHHLYVELHVFTARRPGQ